VVEEGEFDLDLDLVLLDLELGCPPPSPPLLSEGSFPLEADIFVFN
jgi:hypothetical protein